jgi:alanine racemase
VPVLAVVKADAYGHGAAAVARALEAQDAAAGFAVSLVEEGVELRDAGIARPVLVMGPSLAGGHREVVARGLTPVVSDEADLEPLAELGRARGASIACHLKIDTGMGRLGVADDRVGAVVGRALAAGGVAFEGLCTHLADADLADADAALASGHAQLARFAAAVRAARAAGAAPSWLHAANSAASIRLPGARFDRIRPGLALYGNGLAPEGGALAQALRLVSHVAQLRAVPAGAPVGYGGLWRAPAPSRIAVLPIGYADGFPRRLTGRAEALVRGQRCPVVGAISMDITLVDVTALGPQAAVGDEVVLLGAQGGERVTAAELAARAGITEYEVTCGVSKRVPRVHR